MAQTEQIGDNRAALLRSTYDELVELEDKKIDLKEKKKGKIQALKKYKVPVASMVKVQKQNDLDEKVREKKIAPQLEAGAILGLPAWVGEVNTDDIEHGHDDSVVDECKAVVDEIIEIDEKISEITSEQKQRLKECKDAGLATKVIKVIVDFQCYPERRKEFGERNIVMTAYRQSLNITYDDEKPVVTETKPKKETKAKPAKAKAKAKPKAKAPSAAENEPADLAASTTTVDPI